jgi:hypothetical protein
VVGYTPGKMPLQEHSAEAETERVKVCPHCAEALPDEAGVCTECGKDPTVVPVSVAKTEHDPDRLSFDDGLEVTRPGSTQYKKAEDNGISTAKFVFLVLVAIAIVWFLRAAGIHPLWVW